MQGMMFCVLALGWYLRKKGMIDKSGKALLSNLVMNVTLPASIIKSFQMEFSMDILKLTLEVIVISFLIQIISNGLSRVLYPGWNEESRKVLQYATIVSNAGILGNAIAEGIFGDLGIMYAAVYTIPTRIFMWSVGLTYFTEAPTKKELVKKVLTHPCIIAIFTGMVLLISQFQLPGFVNQTVRTIAGANTFCAMLLIGCTLAEVPFKEVFSKEVSPVPDPGHRPCRMPVVPDRLADHSGLRDPLRDAGGEHECSPCGQIWKRRPPGNEDRCLFHGRLIDHTSDLVLFPAVGDPVGLSR